MHEPTDLLAATTADRRVGVVSYLNTLPLIEGLEKLDRMTLHHSVPSLLIDALLAGEIDVGLCSSIDYLASPEPLVIVPAGMLGCRGSTLTVRLYSERPPGELDTVLCDTDSHTSVVLMQIVLRERYGVTPEIVPYNAREHTVDHRVVTEPEAVLLIGDKVVTDSPSTGRYPHQLDLGASWMELTGLPFVFAAWMGRANADQERLRAIGAILDHQRRHNRERLDEIVRTRAAQRSWPRDVADRYLKRHLSYDFDDEAMAGLTRFHRMAGDAGLVDEVRPLRVLTI